MDNKDEQLKYIERLITLSSYFSLHIHFLFIVPLPCIMGPWSSWVGPDQTGTMYRYRQVIRPALNGGEKCDDLMTVKKGRN